MVKEASRKHGEIVSAEGGQWVSRKAWRTPKVITRQTMSAARLGTDTNDDADADPIANNYS